MAIKTIFLDRDGVINEEVNYLHKIEKFKFIDGVFDACQYFQKLNYEIIVVSNQSGIARGYFKDNDYIKLTKWMLDQFKQQNISILDTFYCPHGPDSKCHCRKPQPGMFFDAKHNDSIIKYLENEENITSSISEFDSQTKTTEYKKIV